MSPRKFLAVLLAAPALAVAQVNTLPAVPHLLVKGHAEVRYVPDRFTINLLVQVTDKDPDAARVKVEAHMRQIFTALENKGALRGRIQASSLQIGPNSEYRDNKQVFVGTRVSRTVSAVFDDLDKLRGFIAQVPANEQVQIQSTEMGAAISTGSGLTCASVPLPTPRMRPRTSPRLTAFPSRVFTAFPKWLRTSLMAFRQALGENLALVWKPSR